MRLGKKQKSLLSGAVREGSAWFRFGSPSNKQRVVSSLVGLGLLEIEQSGRIVPTAQGIALVEREKF